MYNPAGRALRSAGFFYHATLTPHWNAQYKLPVLVQFVEEVRYWFFLATREVYPERDLIVYNDAPGEGWTAGGVMDKSNLAATAFIRTGRYSHAIGPGKPIVEYVYDDPEGIDLFGYSHLEFYINGGEGYGQVPSVANRSLSSLGIAPETDKWTKVFVTISDLPSPLRTIRIRGSVEDPFYNDDMR